MWTEPGAVRSGARALGMLSWSLAFTNAALLYLPRLPEGRAAETRERWVRSWAGGLLHLFGVQQSVAEAAPARTGMARLVVSNHRSPLDILLMLQHCGGCVLSRADLQTWPILGRAAREGGTIFVDRADPRSGVKAIREIRRHLVGGRTVIVFPEGTTHGGDDVRPFVGGAFSAVSGLAAELLPVGVAYDSGAEFVDESFAEHVARVARRPRTRIGVCFGEAVPAGSDRRVMAAQMRERVQALVVRARAALDR